MTARLNYLLMKYKRGIILTSNARNFWLLVSIILISMPALAIAYNRVIQVTFGMNGTCGIGNMTEARNHKL